MKKLSFILILLVSLVLTGCHSGRKALKGGAADTEALAQYETVIGQSFDFDCLQSKVKIGMGGKSLGGKLSVEHGKRLCLTLTVMGIEMARVEADQDYLCLVDKIDKVYAEVPIAEVAARLGMEDEARYEALEALFLGRIFLPGKGYAGKGDFQRFEWTALNEGSEQRGSYRNKGYVLNYILGGSGELRKTEVVIPGREGTVSWTYDEMQDVEGKGKMPARETVSGALGATDMSLQLTVNAPALSKKGWNSFDKSTYRQVSFAELVEMIKKLK